MRTVKRESIELSLAIKGAKFKYWLLNCKVWAYLGAEIMIPCKSELDYDEFSEICEQIARVDGRMK